MTLSTIEGLKALSTRAVCSVSITLAHVTTRGLIMGAAQRYRWPYQNMSLVSKTTKILSKQFTGTHHNADESARYAQVRKVQDIELCANIKKMRTPMKAGQGTSPCSSKYKSGCCWILSDGTSLQVLRVDRDDVNAERSLSNFPRSH